MSLLRTALRAVWEDLTIHTLRTGLTLLGLALGSGSLVVLGWLLTSAEEALSRFTMEATGAEVLSVDGEPHDPWLRVRRERWLGEQDGEALASRPALHVSARATTRTVYGRTASVGARSVAVAFASGGAEFAPLSSYEVAHGRWPFPAEDGQRVCVIGADVFRELYPGGWPADAPLVLDGARSCRVVGALAPKPATAIEGVDASGQPNRRVFLPATTFERVVPSKDQSLAQVHLAIEGAPGARAALIAPVEQSLVALHEGAHNFRVGENASGDQVQRLILLAIEALLVSGVLVATFVGGINVMNVQLVTLAERTREYGICRALGLSRRTLAQLVLLESVLLGLLGACIGVGGGLAIARIASSVLGGALGDWPFVIAPWSVILAVVSAVLAGALAGLVPARRAFALLPRECLAEP